MNTPATWWDTAWSYATTSGPAGVVTAAALGLLVLVVIWQAARRAGPRAAAVTRTVDGRRIDDALTFVVAGIVTVFSAQGMWRFFGDSLHLDQPILRVALFAMFELTMLTCALRARRRVKDPQIGSAGIEGVMVWVTAATSGVLSASDADTAGGIVIRLISPMFAAFLWERGMSIERRKADQRRPQVRIHWRITPERVLVWLGLAEASDRTATEVDTQRRMTRVALAAHRVQTLDAARVTGWRRRRAGRRLIAAMRGAVDHTTLATDPAQRDTLLAQLGALYHAETLATLTPPSPWTHNTPTPTPAVKVVMVNPLALMPRPDRDDTVSLADLSQSDQIRHAIKVTRSTDPGDVVAWLADHDVTVVRQRVSDVIRRDGITSRTLLESLPSRRESA
ncbi:MAG: hypothetical protein ACRDP6_29225 [Actinoallomurus sp.]